MPKKVYDVIPPKVAKKVEESVKNYLQEERSGTARKSARRNNARQNKKSRPLWVPVLISGGVVVLIAGVYLFFKLPKADINIWPKVETLSFKQEITADASIDLPDITEGTIPAKQFKISKTLSEDFSATGNASDEGRASGVITIYNKYDPPQSVTFRAGTHFLSDSGKLFRAEDRIIIPAAKKVGGKITPGSIQIMVRAVEGGESYNIPASDFSIPGLKGTAFYYSLYASSESAMAGGYTGDIKKVTENDIESAKDAISKKLVAEAKEELKSQISPDYVLLDGAILSEIIDSGTKTKAGTVVDKFTYESSINLSVLAFKKSDLEEFSKKYIISQTPEGKTLLDTSLVTEYSIVSSDVAEGKMVMDLNFSSGIYKSLDKNSMSLSFTGKDSNQINEAVSSLLGGELSRLEVKFWPFWVSKAPKNQKAINVSLRFE